MQTPFPLKKWIAACLLPSLILATSEIGWTGNASLLRPRGALSRDGGEASFGLKKALHSEKASPDPSLRGRFKRAWREALRAKKRVSATTVLAALLSTPLSAFHEPPPTLPPPPPEAPSEGKMATYSIVNGLMAGSVAAVKAPHGKRWRAFLFGLAGGTISAYPSFKLVEFMDEPGGSFLIRGINAYGANVVRNAHEERPFWTSLTHFRYPLGPGFLEFEAGRPRRYIADAARTATLLGGIAYGGRLDLGGFLGTGGATFLKIGRDRFQRLSGSASFDAYEMFGTVFLAEDFDGNRPKIEAHEFAHLLQSDHALLWFDGVKKWHFQWPKRGGSFRLSVNVPSYLFDLGAENGVKAFPYEERPNEKAAFLFEDIVIDDQASKDTAGVDAVDAKDGGTRSRSLLSGFSPRASISLLKQSI